MRVRKMAWLGVLMTASLLEAGTFDAWPYRMTLEVAGAGGTESLTGFPVLVVLSNNVGGSGFSYDGFLSPSGGDLRFAASNETDELAYEIEKWDASGESFVWVRVPDLSPAGARLYAYWGGTNTTPPSASVWDTNYVGVWHMAQANSPDATGNGRNATAYGTVTAVSSGRVDGACDFDATADYLQVADHASLTLGSRYTVSAWIRSDPRADYEGIVGTYSGNGFIFALDNSANNLLGFWTSASGWRWSAYAVPDGGWKHVAYMADGANGRFYVDGRQVGTVAAGAVGDGGVLQIAAGGSSWGTYRFDGLIDEVRVSNTARGSNWLWASWLNQASNSAFVACSGAGLAAEGLSVQMLSIADAGVTNATANGRVIDTAGGGNPVAYACWGYADAGTNGHPSAWPFVQSIGAVGGNGSRFSQVLGGLLPGSNYVFRWCVSNSAGLAWSTPAEPFATRSALYVSLAGDGSDGTSWATAYTNLQAALDRAGSSTSVLVAGQAFALTNTVNWTVSGAVVMGGFEANPSAPLPGSRDPSAWPTLITRTGGVLRLMQIRNLTNALLDGVTLSNGYMTVPAASTAYDGAGLRVESASNVTVRGCRILNCTLVNGTDHHQGRGAGLLVSACSGFRLLDSEVSGNYSYGTAYHGRGWAGGMMAASSDGLISNCVFSANRARAEGGNYDYTYSRAGGLYISGGASWTLERTVFSGNRALHSSASAYQTRGGGLYVDGSPRVILRNCLLAGNDSLYQGDGLYQAGGALSFDFCTIVSNRGSGLYKIGGTAGVTNSILWRNGDDLYGFSPPEIGYSRVDPIDDAGERGNLAGDPIFADTNHWHLASRAGFLTNGYFNGGSWTAYGEDSPLLDAADPGAPFAGEAKPHGNRANMGAYGGTEVASKTFLEEPGVFTSLTIHQYAPTEVGVDNATFNGEVVHDGGGTPPSLFFCYGPTDGGTLSTGAWAAVRGLGTHGVWEPVSLAVTGLAGAVQARFYVTNSLGEDWSLLRTVTLASAPSVTNEGALAVRRRTATLRASITDDGGVATRAWFQYWPQAGGTTSEVYMSFQTAGFQAPISNLSPATVYETRVLASNAAGAVWSGVGMFETLTDGPIVWYASTNGDHTAGTNWATALTNLHLAFSVAESNDTLRVAGHVFELATAVVWTVSGVLVEGSYAATNAAETPGPRDPERWPTILTRSVQTRLFHALNLTGSVLDGVTLSNGYLTVLSSSTLYDGVGLRVENTRNFEFRNGRIVNNTLLNTTDHFEGRGAGLLVTGSSGFRLTGATVYGNSASANTHHNRAWAGGMMVSGGSGLISNCLFLANRAYASGGNETYTFTRGAGLYISGGTNWLVARTVFASNRAEHAYAAAYQTRGGGVYVDGAASQVRLRNCLLAGNYALYTGDGMAVEGGSVAVESCTFLTNGNSGLYRSAGTVGVTNSILWANGDDLSGTVSVAWCDIETADPFWTNGVAGCFSADPLFVDPVYGHLKSKNGQYAGGYFSGGAWQKGSAQSPAIDAGDPASPFDAEPPSNGRRINLGAYGNTEIASKSIMPGSLIMLW